jgi:glutamate dehydrogenase (NAD(P)+)
MVESYFDKAGKHTNIKADKLNFYKKSDNVVKFHLTLTRGSIKMI